MPDLTIEYMQQCASTVDGSTFHIGGYEQHLSPAMGYDTCTCKAYKFSKGDIFDKTCKHIKEAREQLCTYHEQIDGPPEVDGVCPKCGGPTTVVRVGV